MSESRELHLAYRPQDFDEFYGNEPVINSLKKYEKNNDWDHCYLFTGSPGTGKTTLARIVANKIGVPPHGLIEVDSALYSGVNEAKDFVTKIRISGMGKNKIKFVIMDECHRLSKQAWDVFLKITEEPPKHLYFAFCSSEASKVPKAIQTRAVAYNLKDAGRDIVMDLLEDVCASEGIELPKGVDSLIAKHCDGSPREALTSLSLVSSAKTKEEAAELLDQVVNETDIIELAKLLCFKSPSWDQCRKVLEANKDANPESIRLTVLNYAAACLIKEKSDSKAEKLMAVIDAFSEPCNTSEKMAPILLAVGSLTL